MAILKANPENADLAIFNHAIFRSNEFQEYQQLVIGQEETYRPEERSLVELNPLLAEVIKSQMLVVNDKIDAVNNRVNMVNAKMDQDHQEFIRQMNAQFSALKNTPLYFGGASSNNGPSTSFSNAVPSTSSSNAHHSPTPGPSVPQYKLSRKIQTVHQVWEEYEHGIFGGPSVKQLIQTYDKAWRKHPTEARFFLRRQILYQEMKDIAAAKGITLEDAARDLDRVRRDNRSDDSVMSLDALSKMIQAKNKQEE